VVRPEASLPKTPLRPNSDPRAVNRVLIAGAVRDEPRTRHSAAGVPISRFVLDHQSYQEEAGVRRSVACALVVFAAGTALQPVVGTLGPGRRVRVSGFLNVRRDRGGDRRLVLHAQSIEDLELS
jgi:primosomal replication protein N